MGRQVMGREIDQLYSELNFESASQNGSSRCLIVVDPARWW
jgi:hypothetical protein